MSSLTVALVGGPHDGRYIDLIDDPLAIVIGDEKYVAVVDAETGALVGPYMHEPTPTAEAPVRPPLQFESCGRGICAMPGGHLGPCNY